MQILVLGGGGREHALSWAIARSPRCSQVFCVPGNGGTQAVAPSFPLDVTDHRAVVAACEARSIDLVVVGPEQPLVDGLADALRAAGIAVFGPDAAPAQLEGSKSFAKEFMARHGIPTAAYDVFDDGEALIAHLASCPVPVVVKADGLAGGKGVLICMDRAEAVAAGQAMAREHRFGAAGARVVVEEFMEGEEASLLALVDGETVVVLPPLQDHKRRFDGDEGPNTGGMGAYSPVPAMTQGLIDQAVREVLEPAARGLVADGTPYRGVLYAGLMLTSTGPRVVEFNCRFGDPECQPLILALTSDLLPLLDATARGVLADQPLPSVRDGAVCCVVMVSGGYPGSYPKGMTISGIPVDDEDVVVFHAGTRLDEGDLVTSGGRVLGVTARGDSFAQARSRAYDVVRMIQWEGAAFREDIGWRALQGETTQ
ncbi:MAG: phosphoribosylamine--glycine ligase [Deltaproteobacteria bacterium]|nr:phosphoribosylamine--glycine ligase [Deltaproteobacteria bacterium]